MPLYNISCLLRVCGCFHQLSLFLESRGRWILLKRNKCFLFLDFFVVVFKFFKFRPLFSPSFWLYKMFTIQIHILITGYCEYITKTHLKWNLIHLCIIIFHFGFHQPPAYDVSVVVLSMFINLLGFCELYEYIIFWFLVFFTEFCVKNLVCYFDFWFHMKFWSSNTYNNNYCQKLHCDTNCT